MRCIIGALGKWRQNETRRRRSDSWKIRGLCSRDVHIVSFDQAAHMTKRDRVRRAALLCTSFARNLAYHRGGNKHPNGWKSGQLDKDASFWRTVNGNCIDQCVLDWCKLFSDRSGQHHWRRVVSNPKAFEAALLRHLRATPQSFEKYRKGMKA